VRDGLEILYVLGCSSLGELKISASKLTWISSDHLENLEGIESFSSCEHISILGLGIPDISAIKSLSGVDSKVKVVELPENSPGISQANSLLRNIQVVPYSR